MALCALAWLLCASLAFAVGRVEWKSKTLKEADNKSWKVDIAIHLPKPPDLPTLPMKFEFQPVVYYERSMLDGDKLVERKVPLENRQALIESVDVGFLDPGTGKIEKRTKFVFKVTRGHGYEAGEYQVTIRDGRSGDVIGTPTRLIFQGENELIDRRAMVFAGNEKKKKRRRLRRRKRRTASPKAPSRRSPAAVAAALPARVPRARSAARCSPAWPWCSSRAGGAAFSAARRPREPRRAGYLPRTCRCA
jgi:hypothetical protein